MLKTVSVYIASISRRVYFVSLCRAHFKMICEYCAASERHPYGRNKDSEERERNVSDKNEKTS